MLLNERKRVFYEMLEKDKSAVKSNERTRVELAPQSGVRISIVCPKSAETDARELIGSDEAGMQSLFGSDASGSDKTGTDAFSSSAVGSDTFGSGVIGSDAFSSGNIGVEYIHIENIDADGLIPDNFEGDMLVVWNNPGIRDISPLTRAVASGAYIACFGEYETSYCMYPDPGCFIVSRAAVSYIGSLDFIFNDAQTRLADYAIRVLMYGGKSVQIKNAVSLNNNTSVRDGLPVRDSVPVVSQPELFIAKHGFAIPSYMEETGMLLDAFDVSTGNPLVGESTAEGLSIVEKTEPGCEGLLIADTLPAQALRLLDAGYHLNVYATDTISARAAEKLPGSTVVGSVVPTTVIIGELSEAAERFSGKSFDLILISAPAGTFNDFLSYISGLLPLLSNRGKILCFNENSRGLHNLGNLLTMYDIGGFFPAPNQRSFNMPLEKMGYVVESKNVLCDMETDGGRVENVLTTLMAAYPENSLPMRNMLSLRLTLYQVSKSIK